jgi:hypothetical protein
MSFMFVCLVLLLLPTLMARSASSRASLSRSILIDSFVIERFGDASACRAVFVDDFDRFDGDID